jgi:hypothetical protein
MTSKTPRHRAPGVLARPRSFAYSILRFNQSDTIGQDRYAAALEGIEALNNSSSVAQPCDLRLSSGLNIKLG